MTRYKRRGEVSGLAIAICWIGKAAVKGFGTRNLEVYSLILPAEGGKVLRADLPVDSPLVVPKGGIRILEFTIDGEYFDFQPFNVYHDVLVTSEGNLPVSFIPLGLLPSAVGPSQGFEEQLYNLTITVDPEDGGTTVPPGTYLVKPGYSVTVAAIANDTSGYFFLEWNLDGEVPEDTNRTVTVIMDSSHTLTARFQRYQPLEEDAEWHGEPVVQIIPYEVFTPSHAYHVPVYIVSGEGRTSTEL